MKYIKTYENLTNKLTIDDFQEGRYFFEQEGDSMALMLSIPVLRAKDEEEIQELIKLEEEAKTKAIEEEASQEDEEEIFEVLAK